MTEELMAWSTDEHGFLTGVPHHDGNVSGFSATDDGKLCVAWRATTGECFRMALSGVHDFAFESMCNWDIIFDINIRKISSVPERELSQRSSAWSILYRSRAGEPDVAEWATRACAKQPNSWLVSVTSSYVGAMAALCTQVKFVRVAASE